MKLNFVEAILQGLKPGMTVKAEAFFPTLAYEVKWEEHHQEEIKLTFV